LNALKLDDPQLIVAAHQEPNSIVPPGADWDRLHINAEINKYGSIVVRVSHPNEDTVSAMGSIILRKAAARASPFAGGDIVVESSPGGILSKQYGRPWIRLMGAAIGGAVGLWRSHRERRQLKANVGA
jgi:hypothetical protein